MKHETTSRIIKRARIKFNDLPAFMGRFATAVGEFGGRFGEITTVYMGKNYQVRDVDILISDEQTFDEMCDAIRRIDGVDLITVMDVVRETHYQDLRRHFSAKANEIIRTAKQDDLRRRPKTGPGNPKDTHYAWRLIRALQKLDVAYGAGDFDKACAALDALGKIEASVSK